MVGAPGLLPAPEPASTTAKRVVLGRALVATRDRTGGPRNRRPGPAGLDHLAADHGVSTLDAIERARSASVASVFTIEQIEELHARLGNAETLADYVRSLAALGVARYDSFVSDGHSEYLGRDAQRVTSHAVHDELTVA
jgi:hypothetical protein